jgi:hypothetical protein
MSHWPAVWKNAAEGPTEAGPPPLHRHATPPGRSHMDAQAAMDGDDLTDGEEYTCRGRRSSGHLLFSV